MAEVTWERDPETGLEPEPVTLNFQQASRAGRLSVALSRASQTAGKATC